MTRSNPPVDHLLTAIAVFVAVHSILLSLPGFQVAHAYGSALTETASQIPLPITITLAGYKWLWLGVVVSFVAWFMHYSRQLSRRQALPLLGGVAVVDTLYLLVMVSMSLLPTFSVFEKLG